MSYFVVQSFKAGLDLRRHPAATAAGAVTELVNAHVTPGGELEKRLAFVEQTPYDLTNTVGLAAVNDALFVFGTGATPAGMTRYYPGATPKRWDEGLNYVRLDMGSNALTVIRDWEVFAGKLWVVAGFESGLPPPEPWVWIEAAEARKAEGDAGTTTFSFTVRRVGDTSAVSSVGYAVTGAGAAPADLDDFGGELPSGVIELAPGVQTQTLEIAVSGDVTDEWDEGFQVTLSNPVNADLWAASATGVILNDDGTPVGTEPAALPEDPPVVPPSEPVLVETRRFYDTRLVGDAPGGPSVTFGSKIYTVGSDTLYFSALGDPEEWEPEVGGVETGAGFVNLAAQDAGATDLRGIEVYYNQLALFGAHSVLFWTVTADPAGNQQDQALRSIGLLGPRTPAQFGDGDVLFLAASGIRSLKARTISNAAGVTDVGSPIDALVTEAIRNASPTGLSRAWTLIDPATGRFWLGLDQKIFVLSYYPAPGVTAWSVYEPEFLPTDAAVCGERVFLRSGSKLYLYGGADGETYDAARVRVTTPYLSDDRPATFKMFQAVDFLADGAWSAELGLDPRNPELWEPIGVYDGVTYPLGRMGVTGMSTHAAFRLTHEAPGYARLAQMAFHYQDADAS